MYEIEAIAYKRVDSCWEKKCSSVQRGQNPAGKWSGAQEDGKEERVVHRN